MKFNGFVAKYKRTLKRNEHFNTNDKFGHILPVTIPDTCQKRNSVVNRGNQRKIALGKWSILRNCNVKILSGRDLTLLAVGHFVAVHFDLNGHLEDVKFGMKRVGRDFPDCRGILALLDGQVSAERHFVQAK